MREDLLEVSSEVLSHTMRSKRMACFSQMFRNQFFSAWLSLGSAIGVFGVEKLYADVYSPSRFHEKCWSAEVAVPENSDVQIES